MTLVHRRGQLRAQEHLASQIFERQIPILWHTELREIHGKAQVEEVVLDDLPANETWTMAVEGIFIAIGYLPTVDLAQRIGVKLTEEGCLQHDGRHRTNLAGIYSAGDAEGGFKQIVTAAGGGRRLLFPSSRTWSAHTERGRVGLLDVADWPGGGFHLP